MESYLPISYLNDFIFCPRSIYYHQLYSNFNQMTYQGRAQSKGTASHTSIDQKNYSNDTSWLIGIDIYSQQYTLCGKIDLYNKKTGTLRERKHCIKTIYDGYIYQVYAQLVCLEEMGYPVQKIELYDMSHNKTHRIALPSEDLNRFTQFQDTINSIRHYKLDDTFEPNAKKCQNCIYSSLCDKTAC